jgi:hypothetical protein
MLVEVLKVIGGHKLGPKHKFAGILRDGMTRLREKIQGSTKVWEVDTRIQWEL